MKKIVKLQSVAAATGITAIAAFAVVPGAFAATDSSNTVINANIGSTISVTSGATVTLNVAPTAGGSITTASDTVTVTTNDSNGYTLALSTSTASTALAGTPGGSIPASSGTQGAPISLAANTWGYRVDGQGGFGAGPTTAVNNAASESHSWAGVPASGSADTINTTTGATSGEATTVWYGLNATTASAGGTYTNTVVYTATTR
ncbi:hypothetical protein FWG95_01450 [Candidatus Saccharibacteria bacterium]|nr:hypothetical protein [Candidatus Saccharibacteria bacterium]